MRKVVFIVICIVGLFGFTSCGSTAPCGLTQKAKRNQQNNYQQEKFEIIEVSVE